MIWRWLRKLWHWLIGWDRSPSKVIRRRGKISYLYLMYDPLAREIKIGRSTEVSERYETFRTANRRIKLIYYAPETHGCNEADLHEMYARKRIELEWFRLNRHDVEKIKRMAGE
jgi:hypothetical protein